MKTQPSSLPALLAALFLAVPALAQPSATPPPPRPAEDRRIGITHVEVTPSVRDAAAQRGKGISLNRVLEAMDKQMISAFNDTRKFDVVAWSDLKKVVDVGNANQALGNAQSFAYAGCRYSVQVTLDDFQDFEREVILPALNERHIQRMIHASAVVLIYDTTTGKLHSSTNIQSDSAPSAEQMGGEQNPEKQSDALLLGMARNLSELTALRVTDTLFPMKVVARSGTTVTLNRGDAFQYQPGMLFDVFALGEELIDPDTGRNLGRQEERIGQVRIVSVLPETCRAEILVDQGIDRGQIVRPTPLPPGPASPSAPPLRQ